MKRETIASMFG